MVISYGSCLHLFSISECYQIVKIKNGCMFVNIFWLLTPLIVGTSKALQKAK